MLELLLSETFIALCKEEGIKSVNKEKSLKVLENIDSPEVGAKVSIDLILVRGGRGPKSYYTYL